MTVDQSSPDHFPYHYGVGTRANGGLDPLALHVGKLPGRKSWCFYTHEGSVINVLAYFRDEESARRAGRALAILTGVSE